MSSQLSDAPHSIRPPISSPPRHKHAVTRSITEASSLPKLHRSNHSNIHRHNGKDRDKHQDKNEKSTTSPNPTLQPNALLTSVEAGAPRSEGATPANSQTVSRRTSLLGMNRDQDGAIPTLKVEGKTPKEVELGEERERGVLRASELRNALSSLNTLSSHVTRRLDITYYSVLEKLGVLQNTIASLTELAQMTRLLNEEFGTESEKVVKDIGASLDGFHGFATQQRQIEELSERVKAGRDKVNTLRTRVDLVRDRVEGWERAEGEWQDRTRKRMRVLWILMSVAAAVFVALSIFRYTPVGSPGLEILTGLNVSDIVGSVPEPEPRNETWTLKKTVMNALENMSSCDMGEEPLEEDPRLRLFDEL